MAHTFTTMPQPPAVETNPDWRPPAVAVVKKKLRIADIVAMYSISRSTVYRLFASGDLTPIKRNRLVLVDAAEVEAWASGSAK